MRRASKEGYSNCQIQLRMNEAYWAEPKRRAPADAAYPGCDARGWAIQWAPRDRFAELNHLAFERKAFKWRYDHATLDIWYDRLAGLHRILNNARFADKPRLP